MARGAYYQPQGKQRVSRAWRNRVKFLWNAACPDTDIVTGRGFSLLAGSDLIPDGGLGGKMMRSGNGRGRRFTPQYVGPVFSVGVLVADTVQGATRNPFDADDQGNEGRLYQLRLEASNVGNFIPFNTGGSPFFSSTPNTAPTTGLSLLGASMGVGGIARSFLNGSFGDPVSVGSPRFPDGTKWVTVGNFNDPATSNLYSYQGGIYLAFIIEGALATEEWADLYANPWQLLEGMEGEDIAVTGGGEATATPAGVGAVGSVGICTASAGASAAPAGVDGASSAGSPVATGGARADLSGVQAVTSVGQPLASSGSAGQAAPAGVAALAAVGIATCSAGAGALPEGVSASATIGQVIAAGSIIIGATAMPAGVSAQCLVGAAIAYVGDLVQYSRAPLGAGYAPQRYESEVRPTSAAQLRPAAQQRNNR